MPIPSRDTWKILFAIHKICKEKLQNNLDLELMYGMPVQVFVNDAYYGLMNARSESNILGISSLLKVNPEEMSMVKVKDESENLKFDEGNRSFLH